jgi:hypothetical protein
MLIIELGIMVSSKELRLSAAAGQQNAPNININILR